jgi:hypothetical protein
MRELEDEGASARSAALVILFPEDSQLVWADSPQRSGELSRSLDAGGLPVGILRIEADSSEVRSRAFCEHADDPEVAQRLRRLVARVRET